MSHRPDPWALPAQPPHGIADRRPDEDFEHFGGFGGFGGARYRRGQRGLSQLLIASVIAGLNVLVAGRTQAGKTTMLNCLSSAIPSRERVVTCEEVFELANPALLRMSSRSKPVPGQGEREPGHDPEGRRHGQHLPSDGVLNDVIDRARRPRLPPYWPGVTKSGSNGFV